MLKEFDIKKAIFKNSTGKNYSYDEMLDGILEHIAEYNDHTFKIIIGTDSQNNKKCVFTCAIVVHKFNKAGTGKGAIYFYYNQVTKKIYSLGQRMFTEAWKSLQMIMAIDEDLKERGLPATAELKAIHLDIGGSPQTAKMIPQLTGLITGNGYEAYIKPFAPIASTVADKHSK